MFIHQSIPPANQNLHVCIISPVYEFFYYFRLFINKQSQSPSLPTSRDERASPAADEFVAPAYITDKRAKATSAFCPHIVCFSYICSYRFIPPQEIQAPKRQKSSFFNMLQCIKKVQCLQWFSQLEDFLDSAKSILHFLLSPQTHSHKSFHISRCKISRTRN